MLVKSALISEGSGALAGMVWSHNAGGQYLRARVVPTNPQTTRQNGVRTNLAELAAYWNSGMSQANRDLWIAYADAVELPGRLGDFRTVSGFNWYIAANSVRMNAGLAKVDAGPSTLSLAMFEPMSLAVDNANVKTVTFVDSADWAFLDGGALILQTSFGTAPTVNFFKGPYAFTSVILGNTSSPPTSPLAATLLSGPGGYAPTNGQRVYWRARIVEVDGRISSAQTGFATVA